MRCDKPLILIIMKKLLVIPFAAACLLAPAAFAQISIDFTSPSKESNAGANGFLGTGGAGFDYTGNFGTWIYSNGNSGIDEAGTGAGDGSSSDDLISSIGVARPQDFRGTNGRAISVIFDGSQFQDGVEYTVSFDVLGDIDGANSGRYWLAELYDYDSSGSNYIQIDGTTGGWGGGHKPFAANGSANVNYVVDDISNNGVALAGVQDVGPTDNSFTFTYNGLNSPDIGFAVGTYNNIYAVDNFQVVPEPAHFTVAIAGACLGLVLLRRRRQKRRG